MRSASFLGAAMALVLSCAGTLTMSAAAAREHTISQVTTMHAENADGTSRAYSASGAASWYGTNLQGHRDARGERFDANAMTAAHRTLPLNSLVQVTNLDNGRAVIVPVTDRGPYARHRLIDVSRAAAEALGFVDQGTAHVRVRAITTD